LTTVFIIKNRLRITNLSFAWIVVILKVGDAKVLKVRQGAAF